MPAPILPLVGIASDAHQLDSTKECWLGGILFPDAPGCEGHSDGDVIAHAIVDAVLSAAGLGDLGSLVGVGRPEYNGVSGVELLKIARDKLAAEGFVIGNAAAQLIAQGPKFGPQRERSQAVLSEALGAPVTVAATTTDHLGFTGRSEGRAAIATALVWRK
ncbi:2-C-methyl-D-erythritol 2,4-cyclodiphosphate synthase [Corynebacterium caspium]|uniref:2-C-methyl-D-erythritol 2,4-cyclodiphosphate synthase n=1 Tax=Corynebacterium caspium TaxID=234828 RepID=UPI00036A2AD6|nr:2-C-methyl-D-erythritol 2,4-cyclodiphosphate synthase [Corynebacterium caspium]WKD58713.1 2-C-methyl-D-erythritol 2,4-cyclodiphosphate synthase [Corynebacterium caspium DSM 44850]